VTDIPFGGSKNPASTSQLPEASTHMSSGLMGFHPSEGRSYLEFKREIGLFLSSLRESRLGPFSLQNKKTSLLTCRWRSSQPSSPRASFQEARQGREISLGHRGLFGHSTISQASQISNIFAKGKILLYFVRSGPCTRSIET
jgi:hypothetical protein